MRKKHLLSFNFKVLLIIILLLIIRIPTFYLWSTSKVVGDDAALYYETAKNLATGKGYQCDMLRHISDKVYLENYIQKHGVKDKMEWIPPLYIFVNSCLYKLVGENYFQIAINAVNNLYFIIFMFLFIVYLRKKYDKNLIIYFSLVFVGLSIEIYRYTFSTHLESLYILTFFILFLYHINIIGKDKLLWYDYLLYSFFISLFIFSKYSAIPFVAAFFIHFLIKKRYKEFFIIAMLSFIMVSPWMFLRSYLISGHTFSGLLRGPFPFSDNIESYTGAIPYIIYKTYKFIQVIVIVLGNYFSIELFYAFFPFILIGFILKDKNDIVRQAGLILLVVSLVFFGLLYHNTVIRYHIVLIPVLIPLALSTMLNMVQSFRNHKIVIYSLFLVITTIQIFGITRDIYIMSTRFPEETRTVNNSIELLKKNKVNDKDRVLMNMPGLNCYYDASFILAPNGDEVKRNNIHEMIDMYKIDYILIRNGSREPGVNVFKDQYFLLDQSTQDSTIKLYSIQRN